MASLATPHTPQRKAFIPERSVSPEPLQPILGRLFHLKGRSKTNIVQTFDIDTEDVLIGRGDKCDVRIHDPSVSREHCRITFEMKAHHASISILGPHGLIVNKENLINGTIHTLESGDVIDIANRRFRFEYSASFSAGVPDSPDSQRAVIPPSPALRLNALRPSRSASNLAAQILGTPSTPIVAKPHAKPPSRRISCTRSTRIHVFPAYTDTDEVRSVIAALADRAPPGSPLKLRAQVDAECLRSEQGIQPEGAVEKWRQLHGKSPAKNKFATPSKVGEDLVYLEALSEDKEQEQEEDLDVDNRDAVAVERVPQHKIVNGPFITPQQPKRTTRAPRTSIAPRVKKNVVSKEAHIIPPTDGPAMMPVTPRSVPLPPSAETPYLDDRPVGGEVMDEDKIVEEPLAHQVEGETHFSSVSETPSPSSPKIKETMTQPVTPSRVPLPAPAATPYMLTWGLPTDDRVSSSAEVENEADVFVDAAEPVNNPTIISMSYQPPPQTPVRKHSNGPISLRRALMLNSVKKRTSEVHLRHLIAQRSQQELTSPGFPTTVDKYSGTVSDITRQPGETTCGPAGVEIDDLPEDAQLAGCQMSGLDMEDDLDSPMEGIVPGSLDQAAGSESKDPAVQGMSAASENNDSEQGHAEHEAHAAVSSRDLTDSNRRDILAEIARLRDEGEVSEDDLTVDHSLDLDVEDMDDEDDRSDRSNSAADETGQRGVVATTEAAGVDPTQIPLPASPSRHRSFFAGWFTPQVKAKQVDRQARKSLNDAAGPPGSFARDFPAPTLERLSLMDQGAEANRGLDQRIVESVHGKQQNKGLERVKFLDAPRSLPKPSTKDFQLDEELSPQPLSSSESPSKHPILRFEPDIVSSDDDQPTDLSLLGSIRMRIKNLRRQSLQTHSDVLGPSIVIEARSDHEASGAFEREQAFVGSPAAHMQTQPSPLETAQAGVALRDIAPAGHGLYLAHFTPIKTSPTDTSTGMNEDQTACSLPTAESALTTPSKPVPIVEESQQSPRSPIITVPATPSFVGLRQLFHSHVAPGTPDMRGLHQLYNRDQTEAEAEQTASATDPLEAEPAGRAAKAPPTRTRRTAVNSNQAEVITAKAPARQTRAAKSKGTEPAVQLPPTKRPSRTRKVEEPRHLDEVTPALGEDETQDTIVVRAADRGAYEHALQSSSSDTASRAPPKPAATSAKSAEGKSGPRRKVAPAAGPQQSADYGAEGEGASAKPKSRTRKPAAAAVIETQTMEPLESARPKRAVASRLKTTPMVVDAPQRKGFKSATNAKSAALPAVGEEEVVPVKRVTRARK